MTDIIYGRHPVVAALRRPESPLEEVIVAQGAGGRWLDEVRRLARAAGVRLRIQERAALDRVCGTPNHQGIAARRGSYAYRSEAELLDGLAGLTEPALLVAADSLTDPMNLGNLCRSAFAAGAHGLIIPKDRAAGVTADGGQGRGRGPGIPAGLPGDQPGRLFRTPERGRPHRCRHRCRLAPDYL